MIKPEWGTKRTCQSCAARFYDMRRNPIICPKCESVFEPPPHAKPRRVRTVAKATAKPSVTAETPKAAESPEATGNSAPSGDDDDAAAVKDIGLDDGATDGATTGNGNDEKNDLIEDASELGKDEDDVTEVPVGVEDKTNPEGA